MSKKGLFGLASKAGDVAAINWYPGHMASATKAIRERIKVVDLVVEVRDARVCHHSFLISPSILLETPSCYCQGE